MSLSEMRQGKGGCPIRTHKNVISKDKGKNKEKENAPSGQHPAR